MAPLAFALECAALAALVGGGTSLLASAAGLLLRPLVRGAPPARRADLAFLLGALPAVAAIAVVLAAAAPSLLGALGLAADHCPSHQHHVHLCLVHGAGLRPLLAALGAASLAVFLFRAAALGARHGETRKSLAALERLGTTSAGRFPLVAVPGGPRLCHAVGVWRPRIVVSAELRGALSGAEWEAALAHEEAHLRRRDPAAFLALSLAGLFALPPLARRVHRAFAQAVEEACDVEAALAVHSPGLVARALVEVAALQRGVPQPAIEAAFGETALERRVQLLLGDSPPRLAPARALALCLGALALGLGAALFHAHWLHHAVETALHHWF